MKTNPTIVLLLALLAGCTTSIDFDAGRPYACEPDAGGDVCGTDWRCGLEGRCHRIGDARAWRCNVDDDCEASWRCGLNQLCHDPAVADAYQCRSGADCEQGWICGRNGLCHDPTVPAAYECVSDDECVAPWRCGLEGRCLDATAEAVDFTSATPGAARRLNPLLPPGVPVVGATAQALALAHAGTVKWIQESRVMLVADAGSDFAPQAIVPDSMGVLAFIDGGARGFYFPGYSNPLGAFDAGAIPLNLDGPWLIDGPALAPIGFIRIGGTREVPRTTRSAAFAGGCLISVDEDGLWVQPDQTIGMLSELSLGIASNRNCGSLGRAATQVDLLRVNEGRVPLVAFRVTPQDTLIATSSITVWDVSGLTTLDERCVPTPPPPTKPVGECGDPRSTQQLRCPVPCEPGDELVDLRPTELGLEAHCLGTSGPTTYRIAYDGRCEPTRLEGRQRFLDVQLEAAFAAKEFSPYRFVATGRHGEIWWGTTLEGAQTLTLDEPPLGVRDGGWFGRDVRASLEPELGLFAKPHAGRAALVENSDLQVLASGSVTREFADGGLQRVSSLGRLLTREDEVHAVASADGGVLIVTVDDQVFIGARDEWLPRLPSAVTPAPGLPLRSLALDGEDAWVSTDNGAWKLVSNRGNWSAQAMRLPAGRVLEVWVEPVGRRVAMRDGQVLSLPNGVKLVTSLPDGEALVDVQPACGQLFGLTRRGLKRVEAQQWVDVALTLPPGAPLLDATLAEGRLFFANGELTLFNGAGVAATLPVQCD